MGLPLRPPEHFSHQMVALGLRSAPKIPSIPAEIKWARIVKYVRHARQLHREKKREWRGQLESWSKREHNRRMVQAQKDLLNREFDNTSKSLLHTMGSGVNAPDAGLLATYARDDAACKSSCS